MNPKQHSVLFASYESKFHPHPATLPLLSNTAEFEGDNGRERHTVRNATAFRRTVIRIRDTATAFWSIANGFRRPVISFRFTAIAVRGIVNPSRFTVTAIPGTVSLIRRIVIGFCGTVAGLPNTVIAPKITVFALKSANFANFPPTTNGQRQTPE